MPNTRTVGLNIIEKDNKILLVQETKEHVRGKWNTPGGRIDPRENIFECAAREGEEETGFKLKTEYLVGVYQHHKILKNNVMLFVFKSKVLGGELIQPNHEVMGLKWFTFDEIKDMKENGLLRAPHVWQSISDYKSGKKYPLEIITVLD